MFYNFDISVAKDTLAATPLESELKITHGIVHKVDFLFPPGCVGLVGVSVHDALHQVWPTNTGTWFASNNETITFREHLEMLNEPFSLTAKIYNLDDTYAHTVTIRLGILPVYILAPWLKEYDDRLKIALGAGLEDM